MINVFSGSIVLLSPQVWNTWWVYKVRHLFSPSFLFLLLFFAKVIFRSLWIFFLITVPQVLMWKSIYIDLQMRWVLPWLLPLRLASYLSTLRNNYQIHRKELQILIWTLERKNSNICNVKTLRCLKCPLAKYNVKVMFCNWIIKVKFFK